MAGHWNENRKMAKHIRRSENGSPELVFKFPTHIEIISLFFFSLIFFAKTIIWSKWKLYCLVISIVYVCLLYIDMDASLWCASYRHWIHRLFIEHVEVNWRFFLRLIAHFARCGTCHSVVVVVSWFKLNSTPNHQPTSPAISCMRGCA